LRSYNTNIYLAGKIIVRKVSYIEEVVTRFRRLLPANTATAQAIDQHEPWEQIAIKAISDGYIHSADQFVLFVEACLQCSPSVHGWQQKKCKVALRLAPLLQDVKLTPGKDRT